MRIIHVITSFGLGGAERLLLDIVNRQVENHEVYIFYLKKEETLIPYLDKRVKTRYIGLSFKVISNLKKSYEVINPHIIHTHVGHADFLGVFSARKSNAKIFCTMHNIYFKKNMLDDLFFMFYNVLFNHIVARTKVISISNSVKKHVLSKLKVPSNRSFLLYNAIAPNAPLQKKKRINEDNDSVTLLFVGRLVKQKAIHLLLNAIKVLKENNISCEIKLLIVGEGELRLYLEQLVCELDIKDIVHFEGETTNVQPYYDLADIFVLPSIWEGFGMVILEAFRAKLPVIASNIEGPSELIKDNYNGLLFNSNNYIELANKIKLLIENQSLRRDLSENGYLFFNENYNIDLYVDKLNKLYEI